MEHDASRTRVESHFSRGKEVLSLSHMDFEVDGVPFRVIGTREEVGDYICMIKNMKNKKISEMDHQRLCRVVRDELAKNEQAAAATIAATKAAEEAKREARLKILPTVELQKGLF